MFGLFNAAADANNPDAILSPETIKARRAMARALIEKGTDTSPVQSPWQGAARIAQALQGVVEDYYATKGERAGQASAKALDAENPLMKAVLQPAQAAPAAQPAPQGAQPAVVPGQMIAGVDDRYTPQEARAQLALWADANKVDLSGLSDKFAIRKAAFLEDNPHESQISITSAYRSPEKQAQMYANRANNPYPVAPPGKSRHNHGEAGDMSFGTPEAQAWSHQNAAKYGLAFPHNNDQIHVELARDGGASPQQKIAQAATAPASEGNSAAQMQWAQRVLSHPYATPGQKAVAQALLQKAVTAETKDPRDSVLKDLSIAEKRKALAGDPLDTEQKKLSIEKSKRELAGKGYRSLVTPEERAAAGVPSEFKGVVQIDRDGQLHFPNKATVEINNQSEKEEDKQRGKGLGEFLTKEATDAPKVSQRAADLEQLGALVQVTDTGIGTPGRVVIDKIGAQLGLSSGQLASKADAINAIVNRIAPTLREPGSGTVSDADLRGFLASLPSLSATPEGNQLILSTLQRAQQISVARASVATQWQQGDITGKEARRQIAELDKQSIYASPKERELVAKMSGGKVAPTAQSGQPAPVAQTAQPSPDGWRDMGNGIRIREKR